MSRTIWFAFVGIVVVMVGVWLGATFPNHQTHTQHQTQHQTQHHEHNPNPVQRLQWEPTKPFSVFASQQNKPLIFTNTIVQNWPARNWDFEKLKRAMGGQKELHGIYRNTNPIFGPYYDEKRPLHGTQFVTRSSSYETNVKLPANEFWDKILSPSPNEFLYLTTEIPDSLVDDISIGLGEFIQLNPKRTSINLWAGQAGVLAPCHYDGYYNFYTVLIGCKRFHLFPPTMADSLRPYPILHPHHAQCQTNISLATKTHRNSAQKITANFPIAEAEMIVDVFPGEVLYLPPMWFHEVETVEPSVAVNVWVEMKEAAVAQMLQNINMDFSAATDANVRAAIASVFIWTFLNAIPDIKSPAHLIARLYRQRYKDLRASKEMSLMSKDGRALVCKRAVETEAVAKGFALHKFTHKDKAETYATAAAKLVSHFSAETRDTWVMNHVEFITALGLGLADVPFFLDKFDYCDQLMREDLVARFTKHGVNVRRANLSS